MSDPSSPESAEWTTDSPEPVTDTSSSANGTPGAEKCSPHDGPERPSTRTSEMWVFERRFYERGEGGPPTLLPNIKATIKKGGDSVPLIFSAGASPARTSQSPDDDEDLQASEVASSSSSPGSSTLFDPDGYSSRTFRVSSLATAVGTSEQSLERWPTSGTAWDGGFSTAVSSECRSADGVCSSSEPSLTEILQPPHDVPARYSLSARAAQGILRRALKRGRTLPPHLERALAATAAGTPTQTGQP